MRKRVIQPADDCRNHHVWCGPALCATEASPSSRRYRVSGVPERLVLNLSDAARARTEVLQREDAEKDYAVRVDVFRGNEWAPAYQRRRRTLHHDEFSRRRDEDVLRRRSDGEARRGAAAAGTRTFRGDESRRHRGWDADIPWRQNIAPQV